MKFTLNIDCGNAAFYDEERCAPAPELTRILRDVADRFAHDLVPMHDRVAIMDINGNKIGHYAMEDE